MMRSTKPRRGKPWLLIFFSSLVIGLGFVGQQTQTWLQAQEQEFKLRKQQTNALIKQTNQASERFNKQLNTANIKPWKPLGDGYTPPLEEIEGDSDTIYSGSDSYRPRTVRVRSYFRNNGTYVRSHSRGGRR